MTLLPPDAAAYVVANCRTRDREEIECYSDIPTMTAVVREMMATADFSCVFYWNMQPAAFVMLHAMTPSCLAASMIATDDWPKVAGRVMRWGLGTLKKNAIRRGFRRLECRAMAGHDDAVRFLSRMGFVMECVVYDFGRNGETFLQFAWRLSDHVHLSKGSEVSEAP